MNAVKFLNEFLRMHNYYIEEYKGCCRGHCPFNIEGKCAMNYATMMSADTMVECVKNFSKNHPNEKEILKNDRNAKHDRNRDRGTD